MADHEEPGLMLLLLKRYVKSRQCHSESQPDAITFLE